MTIDDFIETIGIWKDNWPAVMLFMSIDTQWRAGPGGPIGLDYNVLFHRMDRMGLVAERYDQLFEDIRIMEAEALLTRSKAS